MRSLKGDLKTKAAILLVLIGVLLPAPLRAETDDRARAADYFRKAHTLYKSGDFEGSLAALDRANELFPSHKIELSRAFALEALRRKPEAALARARILKTAPATLDPSVAQKVRKKLSILRQAVSSVIVESSLKGALVKMDGERVGRTPLLYPIYLEPGRHRLFVKKRGLAALTQSLDLDPGEHVREHYSGQLDPIADRRSDGRQRSSRPIYKKWWFWTAITAVVGGTVIAVAAAGGGSSRMPIGDSGTINLDR